MEQDGGMQEPDGGSQGMDSGMPFDGGQQGTDGGQPGVDGGSSGEDGGSTGMDAGGTGNDAGSTGEDGGTTGEDAGSTGEDAGSQGNDGGSTGIDAGSTGADAGGATPTAEFCDSCASNSDCGGNGAMCLEESEGSPAYCGQPCGANGACPAGSTCQTVTDGNRNVGTNCFPTNGMCPINGGGGTSTGDYCNSCTSDSQCGGTGNYCLGETESGPFFCGVACTANSNCPAGSSCQQITDQFGDVIGENCFPNSGTCSSTGESDAGSGESDAGSTGTDAGSTGTDAGSSGGMDAGSSSGTDAGSSGTDAGVPTDAGPYVTIPLTGCAYTTYTAPVTIGTSSTTTFQLIVDTGSSTTAVASKECSNCTGISPLYQDTGTDTGQTTSSSYGDGSGWSGMIYDDSVQAGSEVPVVPLEFAAITDQNGFFNDFACDGSSTGNENQGIIGFGPTDIELSGTDVYFYQLAQMGVASEFAVQLCALGGNMWLGGYDPGFASGTPQFTSMVSSDYYGVDLEDVQFDGTSLGYSASTYSPSGTGAIVDTGTSVFFIPENPFNTLVTDIVGNAAVKSAFSSISSDFFSSSSISCLTPSGGQSRATLDATLPPIQMVFPSASGSGTFTLSFPATSSYLTPMTSGSTTQYCPGIANGGSGNQAMTIIGDTVLSAYLVVFDPGDSEVGFAPETTCP